MSIWQDVRFDRPAALEAADAVRRLAGILDAATEDREHVGVATRRDWQGRARLEADAVLGREHAEAADLVDALRRTAEAIHIGAEAAASEQAFRERRREERRDVPLVGVGPGLVR